MRQSRESREWRVEWRVHTRSSLLPTASTFCSPAAAAAGAHRRFMFSPRVATELTALQERASQTLSVLSLDADASRSAFVECQPTWSTLSVCPFSVWSLLFTHHTPTHAYRQTDNRLDLLSVCAV